MLEALAVVAAHPGVGATGFAHFFWPDKHWQRGGSNPASRHGGKMLWRLRDADLVGFTWDRLSPWLYSAYITPKGERLLAEQA